MSAISVLILTLNEEGNLADCIDSCGWSDDIVVFDSLSHDRTVEIARAKGARVFERRFDNYAAQRNAALTTVSYKHEWVLMVDADERVPAGSGRGNASRRGRGWETRWRCFGCAARITFSASGCVEAAATPAGSAAWSGSAASAWSAR